MNLKGQSSTATSLYLADDRDYMQILEICRPFYFPSSDINNTNNANNTNNSNSNPPSYKLAPRLDDVLVRVVTPPPHERSVTDIPSSSSLQSLS
jgi:hypothetical protein